MRIDELTQETDWGLSSMGPDTDAQVRLITLDSRQVQKGDIFVALDGDNFDGHNFISDALARGAAAVIGSKSGELGGLGVPAFIHQDPRAIIGGIAARLCGYPSRHLDMVGITGTNGKTTTLNLLQGIEVARGRKTGTIGTLGASIDGVPVKTHLTTPEAPDIQSLLAQMRDAGCDSCIMEVSSHGIATRRVSGIDFSLTAFTNLSLDHLDFHGTMEEYGETKAKLVLGQQLSSPTSRGAVLNLDDDFAARLAPRLKAKSLPYFGVSISDCPDARGHVRNITLSDSGIKGELILDGSSISFSSRLIGKHNLENILMAAASAHLLGASGDAIAKGIGAIDSIPGRLESLPNPHSILVLVDYAHTPDALRRILKELAAITDGRLICVFGCGGDRDQSKRAEMGRVAALGADIAVITSDNPRTEDPEKILKDILEGCSAGSERNIVEVDRRIAIGKAISLARAGDTVVIAGKGHEDYQIIGTESRHFCDREVAAEELAKRKTKPQNTGSVN